MTSAITVTNKVWTGNSISFAFTYTADLYSEQKLIEWSVGGVVKGSFIGGAFSGGGSGTFAYTSTNSSVTVVFAGYRWYNGAKSTQVINSTSVVFVGQGSTGGTTIGVDGFLNAPPITTTSTSTVLPAATGGYYVSTRIRNPSYTQGTTTRNLKFDLDYSVFLSNLLTVDGIIFVQYSVNGVITKTNAFQTRLFSNGTVNISLTDSSPYPTLAGNSVKVEVFIWGRNSVPWSQNISSTQTLSATTTVPTAPILQIITSSLPNNKLLKWNKDVNATQYNIETFTPSFPNWSSLTGDFTAGTNNDLGDGNYGINVVIGTVAGDYIFRIRAKNSAGYSNYSPTILYTIDPVVIPPTPLPNAPIMENIVSSQNNARLLKWNIDSNATQYNVEVSTPAFPNFISVTGDFTANTVSSTQFGLNYFLDGDGVYQWRIRAKNNTGYSNYSNVTSFTKTTSVPNVPAAPILQMLVSSLPNNKLLKWNKDSSVTEYNIESSNPLTDPLWMSLTGDFATGINNDLGDNNWGINVLMGIENGLWKYRIRAKNSTGYSNYSNVVSYTIGSDIPPQNTDSKNLLSIISKLFAMGTGVGLMVSKR